MRVLVWCALIACKSSHDAPAPAPRPDPRDLPATIDRIAKDALADSSVPSAVVAAVVDGKVAYTHAYGNARIAPTTPATPAMRYSIGSISKQFAAAAILLLVEDGKLTLDDPVGKYVPGLTRGDAITLRQVLSHTSGYPDYAPQDYIIPAWQKPIAPQGILDGWARVPLEFEPGTKWQYSNTNYVIVGLVCERVAGMPLFDFLKARIFGPLGMTSVVNADDAHASTPEVQGYFQRGLGPLHPAPHEGAGWMYAAGELAMTAGDLATWDLAMIRGDVLSAASWKALETEVVLANGAGTRYGLGIGVQLTQGHRELRHGGEVSGFVASNSVLPDDRLAIVVMTNQDASGAADRITSDVRDALLRAGNAPSLATDAVVKQLLAGLAAGTIDRTRLTDDANAYFNAEAIAELATTLAPLGEPNRVEQTSTAKRGGMTARRYTVTYPKKTLSLSVYEATDGRLEQFLVEL